MSEIDAPRPAGHHPPMAFRPPIGFSDFKRIREDDMTYVDKTSVVQRVIHTTSAVFLLPRPRRFGKTLNLSTLRYFLEKSPHDLGRYFEGLKVWNDPAARAHFQRYPVVFLSFKDVKYRSWADCMASVGEVLAAFFEEHRYLLEGLSEDQAAAFRAVLSRQADSVLLDLPLAVLSGDAAGFADILGDLLLNVPASRPAGATPHWGAFLAGLLVATTATHEVRSNRESGRGRYDVALIPRTPGQPGAVMELKVQGRDTVEGVLAHRPAVRRRSPRPRRHPQPRLCRCFRWESRTHPHRETLAGGTR